jgi:hypothetical protein
MRRALAVALVIGIMVSLTAAVPAAPSGFERIGSVKVSTEGGLGQIALRGKLAAVVQRDEGGVALIDMADPRRPKVLGRYGHAPRALDGDVAFSHDGEFLFYARQTRDFAEEGIHVLDVSDPEEPERVFYQPHGGTLRVAYHRDGDAEWVFSLDAIDGLVVSRFVRPAGVLIPVHVDALPALKVGGPASGGFVVDPNDRQLGVPLLYVTTGRTGLEIFDISDPAAPERLGAWSEEGLAALAVRATKNRRIVYAAREYWFRSNEEPSIVALDATDPGEIELTDRFTLGRPADDLWRVQGLSLAGSDLIAAHSHAGLIAIRTSGPRFRGVRGVTRDLGSRANEGAGAPGSPYAMDVVARGRVAFVTDGSNGTLSLLRRTR